MSVGGNNDLCLDICCEILTRVPIKSILRFRSVSKSWNSLISCPKTFKPKTLSDRILLNRFTPRTGDGWSLSSHDMSFSEYSRDLGDDLPGRFRGEQLKSIGSCNGLICLYNHRGDRSKREDIDSFLIYNPAIRKIVELPSLNFSYSQRPHCCAFGFDSKANDYKVMLTIKVYAGEVDYYEVLMFDLSIGVWRKFTPILPVDIPYSMYDPKFYLNDAVYWVNTIMLSFNMSDETFRVIALPAELEWGCTLFMTLSGLIYGMRWNICGSSNSVLVWMMKDYGAAESWTKVATIDTVSQFWPCQIYPLTFHGTGVGELLLKYFPRKEEEEDEEEYVDQEVENFCQLILHNSESGESKCLLSSNKGISDIVFYKESLVLI